LRDANEDTPLGVWASSVADDLSSSQVGCAVKDFDRCITCSLQAKEHITHLMLLLLLLLQQHVVLWLNKYCCCYHSYCTGGSSLCGHIKGKRETPQQASNLLLLLIERLQLQERRGSSTNIRCPATLISASVQGTAQTSMSQWYTDPLVTRPSWVGEIHFQNSTDSGI